MRVAFVSTILSYPWGGADTLWTHAAEAATDRGDTLLIAVSSAVAANPRINALRTRGATVLKREAPGKPSLTDRVLRKLGAERSADDRLIAALTDFRPDVVVFSQGGTYDLILHPKLTGWLRANGVRYRLIANWQQERPQLGQPDLTFIRNAFLAADRINFVSTRNLVVTREHLDLPLPNARVIQNPLRWQPDDVSPWPAGSVAQLATVSRLDESKGIQVLLAALASAGGELPPWQLNIYGQGPYESTLRALAANPALANRVCFRGYVNQLHDIWAENHLMLSPALDDGVPMTIPEAMLCQRPVLATRVGGADDWLRDEETGFICPTPDTAAMIVTLRRALAAFDRWSGMGRAAATAAAARYRENDHLLLIEPSS